MFLCLLQLITFVFAHFFSSKLYFSQLYQLFIYLVFVDYLLSPNVYFDIFIDDNFFLNIATDFEPLLIFYKILVDKHLFT